MLYFTLLYTILYYTILYYTILYYTILYTVLYDSMGYYTLLFVWLTLHRLRTSFMTLEFCHFSLAAETLGPKKLFFLFW